MTVQQRIEELLKQRGWSKYKLAKEAGFYPATVYDWFNDKGYMPDRNSIESICLAFGITQAEFYSGVDDVPKDRRKIVFELLKTLAD